MRSVAWAACFVAAGLMLTALPRASAVLPPPTPKEDVTKLEKPTISYSSPNTREIRIMDLDGTNDRVWMGDGRAMFPTGVEWSPDGERAAVVVFDESDWSYAPYILNLKTGRIQNIEDWLPPGNYIHPAWSADGKWLTVLADKRDGNDIYRVHARSGRHKRLTNFTRKYPIGATWSPDGKIAFSSMVRPYAPDEVHDYIDSEIFVMDFFGRNLANLTNFPTKWDEFPSFSPDGKKIVFRSYRLDIEVPKPIGKSELYMMNHDGSGLERLTFNRRSESSPAWSPDSQWIVYAAAPVDPNDAEPLGFYRMRLSTKENVLIKRQKGYSARWVLAGKSRFLSVDPADKKKAQWGAVKKAANSENNRTSQDSE